MPVKLKEIASRVGKSICTVSVALRGRRGGKVSDATRREILAVAKELGYSVEREGARPGSFGHRDRRGRPKTVRIGIVSGHDDRPYGLLHHTMQAEAVREALASYGYEAAFLMKGVELENERMYERVIRRVTAVISTVGPNEPAIQRIALRVPRIVCLGGASLDDRFFNVTIDYGLMVRRAMGYFHEQGHRQIAYVQLSSATSPRLAAYRDFMHTQCPGWDTRLIQFQGGADITDCRQFVSGAVDRLLALRKPPSAILAHDDEVSLEVLRVLRQRGRRVPDDMALIGFDSTGHAAYTDPPMSAIEYPRARIADVAVRQVLSQIEEDRVEPLSMLVPTQIVYRSTTAPVLSISPKC